jgi:phage-related protein
LPLTTSTKLIQYPVKTGLKRLPARFYRSDAGREPVREWLKSLDAGDRRVIGEDIKDVEFSWPIGMPLVRSLGRDIWEVRSGCRTQKTPKRDVDLAIRRKKGTGT